MSYTLQLKIDGIEGDQRDGMSLEGFGHNITAAGGRSAAPMISDFSFSRFCDRATPLLALAAAEGRYFKEAVLELARADGDQAKFLEIRLTRVRVTNYNISGATGGPAKEPYENFALGFEKIEWVYVTGPSQECRTDWVNEAAVAVN